MREVKDMEPNESKEVRDGKAPNPEALVVERHEGSIIRCPSHILGFRVVPVTWRHGPPSQEFIDGGIFLLPSSQGRIRFTWRDLTSSQRSPKAHTHLEQEVVLLCPVNIINKVPKWLPYSVQAVFTDCEQVVSKIWFAALGARVLFLCTADSKLLTKLWATQFATKSSPAALGPVSTSPT